MAKDIPYAAWKLGLLPDRFSYAPYTSQPDGSTLWATVSGEGVDEHPQFVPASKAITVIDVRQGRLQRMIMKILSQLSGSDLSDRYIHLGYAVVTLSQSTAKELGIEAEKRFIHMSGRRGTYINADDVLDALHSRAYEESRVRNPKEGVEWLHSVAEKIAVAAVRFDLLKQDLDKMVSFDLKEALRLEGDTGPYTLYTYARAARIIEKSGLQPKIDRESASLLREPIERELVKAISKFDLVVEDAARLLSPKTVARYCLRICELFNMFYERHPVLQAEDGVREARLALVGAFKRTLYNALNLLGIEAPDKI